MLVLKANFAFSSSVWTAFTMRSKNGVSESSFRRPTNLPYMSTLKTWDPGSLPSSSYIADLERLTSNHDNIPLLLAELGNAEVERHVWRKIKHFPVVGGSGHV
jgi:hypothetical protein